MKTKSLIFVILAGLLWGTSGIFVNFLAPYGFTSIQMTSVRAAISFICILAFVLIRDKSLLKINLIQLLICCGAGGSLFATAALYYTAMQMTSVSTAVVLMYTSPIYVVVLAVFFLGDKI